MDALLPAAIVFTILSLLALAAGAESREGFDPDDPLHAGDR